MSIRGYFFDPKFQTGWEDTDIRFLLILLGHKTKLCASTKAWHIGSAADNGNTGMFDKNLNYQKRIFRNRMYIIGKYITPYFYIWPTFVYLVNIILNFYIKTFQPNSIGAYREAMEEYKNNIPAIRKEVSIIKPFAKGSCFDLIKYIVHV